VADSVAKKELQLTLKFNADTAAGQAAMKQLSDQIKTLETNWSRAQAALTRTPSTAAPTGGAVPTLRTDVSSVPAFQRPVPVIIMGPNPLPVVAQAGLGGKAAEDLSKGAGGPGFFGSVKGGALKAAGYLAFAAGIADLSAGMTTAIQGLNNEMLTSRERALGFARAIPLVGDALARLGDNVLDMVDRIRDPDTAKRVDRMRFQLPILQGQSAAQFEYTQRSLPLVREAREAEYGARAVGRNPSVAFQGQLLGSALSGFGFGGLGSGVLGVFGEDNPLSAALEGVVGARRGLEAARDAAGAANNDEFHARKAAGRAMSEFRSAAARSRAEAAASGIGTNLASGTGRHVTGLPSAPIWGPGGTFGPSTAGSRFHLEDALQQETLAFQKAQQASLAAEAAITANKERQLELTRKQYELSRAETNLLKTKAGLLEGERDRVQGAGRQFGALDFVSQDALLKAAKRFKAGGRQGVTPEELGMLQANPLTAQLVAERLDQDVTGNRDFQDLLRLTGQRDLSTIQAELAKVKTEVAIKVQLDEEQFQKTLAETLKSMNFKQLVEGIFKNQLELNMRRPEADALRARVERG
jgi:hypothetical protein